MTIHLLRQVTIILILVSLSQFYCADRANTPKPDDLCENFLEKWVEIPKELKFSSCRYERGSQSDKLISEYFVKGTDAAIVQSFLHEKFKMSRLRYVCCGWEPELNENGLRNGSYIDRAGYYYQIDMASGETVEKDWNRIPKFHVSVTKFMSEI